MKKPDENKPVANRSNERGSVGEALDMVDQAWAALDAADTSEATTTQRNANFWQRFDAELGAEERTRQIDHAIAHGADIPAYTEAQKQRFWQRFDAELGAEERARQGKSTWRDALLSLFWQPQWLAAAACMLLLAAWGMQDAPVAIERQPAPAKYAAAPGPNNTQPPKALLQHLPMLQHMAMFEQMEMLQQSPSLKDPKGS